MLIFLNWGNGISNLEKAHFPFAILSISRGKQDSIKITKQKRNGG